MRLIKQRKLYFQDGKSDKLYEVDLCEAGDGEFVVNFRYGRRGTTLKEGTKTVFPVARDEADKVFNKLVDSKIKKGYRDGGDAEDTTTQAEEEPEPVDEAPSLPLPGTPAMRIKIVSHLKAAVTGTKPKGWPLSRVIWRAGELRIAEALAPMVELIGRPICSDSMSTYSLAWAIGRCCGSGDASALEALQQLASAAGEDSATTRIARESMRSTDPAAVAATEALLPSGIREALGSGDVGTLRAAVQKAVGDEARAPFDFLQQLYLLSDAHPHAREVVFEVAQVAPLKPPFFKHIRYLFKAAEYRLDAEMFGMIARRFETSNAFYNSPAWGDRVWIADMRKAISVTKEQNSPTPKIAYSSRTRNYMRQRVVRTMDRAGKANDSEAFITLATGVLLAYKDSDRKEPWEDTLYRYMEMANGRWSPVSTKKHYDEYFAYFALNALLYGNSPRYRPTATLRWSCFGDYKPGQPVPDGREEAFPELWDRAPDALMHILRASQCAPVVEFAVKVWQANADRFRELADVAFVVDLLGKPYGNANELGVAIAQGMFDPDNPDVELLRALVDCAFKPARELGMESLGKCKHLISDNLEFCAALITNRYADVQLGTRSLLTASPLNDSQLEQLVPMVVGTLLEFDKEDKLAPESARNARETLLIIGGAKLRDINPEVIAALLGHGLEDVQLLGANIALQFEDRADEVPDMVLESMLLSDHASVRELGMRLFGKLSDTELLKRQDILASFCISQKADLRQAAQPIAKRLANLDSGFAEEIVARFYPMLLRKESHEGLHDDVYNLLEGSLGEHLGVIPPAYAFRMVESTYAAAQKLGLLVMRKSIDLKQQPMRQVAALGGMELLELREYVGDFYKENPDFIKTNKEDALRILDSDWEDARKRGFLFFRENFAEDDWTPSLLVSVCDSVRPDVQAFGRALITIFFKNEDGTEYLLKLSQHPTAELQTFATNYLERFAAGELERIAQLELFFVTVLCQVNRGRVAKNRVLTFLRDEALKSQEVAAIVLRILSRQSVTIAIGDKAACIQTLLAIQTNWPELAADSPLVRHDFETCAIE